MNASCRFHLAQVVIIDVINHLCKDTYEGILRKSHKCVKFIRSMKLPIEKVLSGD